MLNLNTEFTVLQLNNTYMYNLPHEDQNRIGLANSPGVHNDPVVVASSLSLDQSVSTRSVQHPTHAALSTPEQSMI